MSQFSTSQSCDVDVGVRHWSCNGHLKVDILHSTNLATKILFGTDASGKNGQNNGHSALCTSTWQSLTSHPGISQNIILLGKSLIIIVEFLFF